MEKRGTKPGITLIERRSKKYINNSSINIRIENNTVKYSLSNLNKEQAIGLLQAVKETIEAKK